MEKKYETARKIVKKWKRELDIGLGAEFEDIVLKMHPDCYKQYEEVISDEELIEVIEILSTRNREHWLFECIPPERLFWRCKNNIAILKWVPDEILRKILKNQSFCEELFSVYKKERQVQRRIARLAEGKRLFNEEMTEDFLREVVEFLSWFSEIPGREEAILKKIADSSKTILAGMFEIAEEEVIQGLLALIDEDMILPIIQEIDSDKLDEVVIDKIHTDTLIKNFFHKGIFLYLYEEMDRDDLFADLIKKNAVFYAFEPDTVADFYFWSLREDRPEIMRKLLPQMTAEDFIQFYKILSEGEKLDMRNALDEEDRKIVEGYLEGYAIELPRKETA